MEIIITEFVMIFDKKYCIKISYYRVFVISIQDYHVFKVMLKYKKQDC